MNTGYVLFSIGFALAWFLVGAAMAGRRWHDDRLKAVLTGMLTGLAGVFASLAAYFHTGDRANVCGALFFASIIGAIVADATAKKRMKGSS